MSCEVVVVLCTVPDLERARLISCHVLEAQLAACVNILPGVESHYRWQGKLEHSSELLLILKTQAALFPALRDCIQQHHPYDCPEIISLPLSDGFAPYLQWVKENVQS